MTPGDHYLDNLDADPSAGQPKAMTAEQMQARIVRWLRQQVADLTPIIDRQVEPDIHEQAHDYGFTDGLDWAADYIERGEHLKEETP